MAVDSGAQSAILGLQDSFGCGSQSPSKSCHKAEQKGVITDIMGNNQ